MKKTERVWIFLATIAFNIVFFVLCRRGLMDYINLAYWIDVLFCIIALFVLGFGETSIINQILCRKRYGQLHKREFDKRFILQCILVGLYYVLSVLFVTVLIYKNLVFYLYVLAMGLSVFWTKGSRVLWSGENESFYLDERGKLFQIHAVTENEDVIELTGLDSDGRDRNILIQKRKM